MFKQQYLFYLIAAQNAIFNIGKMYDHFKAENSNSNTTQCLLTFGGLRHPEQTTDKASLIHQTQLNELFMQELRSSEQLFQSTRLGLSGVWHFTPINSNTSLKLKENLDDFSCDNQMLLPPKFIFNCACAIRLNNAFN
ncbi:hypothetical protein BpHYR1_037850 [Brachionus plicatilis]|uniref:Uncharacterized protein n=1 Tax=Brachionus plicatilis TaxID=10195 RepID=A0A3M7RQW4_BRAPC|nr:hypothetical protein BpHYR1_037850 [Brachionus plicatilis]